MANFSIVIVPTKKLSNGRHRIRIAVAHHSKTRYISTQFILESATQLKNGRVVRHENATNMNACLRKLINEYEEIVTSISYLPAISCTEKKRNHFSNCCEGIYGFHERRRTREILQTL